MAKADGNTDATVSADPLEDSVFYRMRRDTMMIVANLNSNRPERPSGEEIKRQIALVQSQLFLAAVADPRLPTDVKNELINFHNQTVLDLLADKRGARSRTNSAHLKHNAGVNTVKVKV